MLETELALFVRQVPAFYTPIVASFPGSSIADTAILQRLTYNQAAQNVASLPFHPYLYWTGPMNSDPGQTARGTSGTLKEDFWFWCCHGTLMDAQMWVDSIRTSLQTLFDSSVFIRLNHLRITAAVFVDSHPLLDDQTARTASEFPVQQSVIGFTFGFQNSGY